MENENSRKRFEVLDTMRGLFCILIVLYHYYGTCNGGFLSKIKIISDISANGNVVVDFFFMISGFCMAVNYKNRIMNHVIRFKDYFVKHYLKFISFALLTLPLALVKQVLVYKAGLDVKPNITDAILDVLCLRSGWGLQIAFPYNSPLWFIAVLLIMYLLYYVVCLLAKGSNTRYVTLCCFIFTIGITLIYNRHIFFYTIQEVTARGYCNFFMGCLLYEVYRMTRNNTALIKRYNLLFILFVTVDVVVYLLGHPSIWGDFRIVFMFLLWPALIWGAVQSRWLERILTVKPLLGLGKLSNSIFIWHHPVIFIIFPLVYMGKLRIDLGSFGIFCIIMLIILTIAFLSNKFLENRTFRVLMSFFEKDNLKYSKS